MEHGSIWKKTKKAMNTAYKHKSTAKVLSIVLLLGILVASVSFNDIFAVRAQKAPTPSNDALIKKVTEGFLTINPKTDLSQIFVSDIQEETPWAFGIVGAKASDTETEPMMILFLAKKVNNLWNVELETSSKFQEWMRDVPVSLVPQNIKFMFAPQMRAASNGANLLSLPWMDGETWKLTGGPHSNSGNASDVWSSLDFQGSNQTGTVVSARDGIVWRSSSCPNFVLITHPDGYKTGYYHLANITVSNGQSISRGWPLGDISTQAGCGGYATGPHVHFSIRNSSNAKVAINGMDIGGWTVQNGTAQYNGCMQRVEDGYRVCQWGTIYNSGVIGSGTETGPPPSGDVRIVNTPSLSKPYGGGMCDSGWYRYIGYGGNYAYLTLSTNQASQSGNTGTWRPNLPKHGTYKVEAYIGVHGVMDWQCPSKRISWDTSDARYTITHASGSTAVTGNQAPYYNEWLNLGNFTFNAGTSGKVYLSDLNGESNLSKTVSFGAMRFTLVSATDTAYPQVTDISLKDSYTPTAPTINFEVTFTENVTGVDKNDFSLTTNKITGASVVSVSGSGKKYTVTVNTGTGNGSLRLNLIDNDSIKDSGNNRLGGVGSGNGNASSGYFSTASKPPLILVHGWQGREKVGYQCSQGVERYDGTNSTLGKLSAWFDNEETGGYDVWIAHWETSKNGTPSLYTNADCLRKQINTVYGYNSQPITIVAHSMGGLVSRSAIRYGVTKEIKALYTLGTPHAGVHDRGVPLFDNCNKQTILCESSEKSIVYFNSATQNISNISYDFIGGSYDWPWYTIGGAIRNVGGSGPNDGLIGQYSAVGWVYDKGVFSPLKWVSSSLPGQYWTDEVHSNFYSGKINDNKWSYYETRSGEYRGWSHAYQCLRDLMNNKTPSSSKCWQANASVHASAQSSLEAVSTIPSEMSKIQTDNLVQGDSVSAPIQIDTAGETLFELSWISGNFELTLTRPDTQVIDLAYAAAHPAEVSYEDWAGSPESAPSKSYHFENAMAGEWQLNISATNAGDYWAYAMMTSPYSLEAETDQDSYSMGDTATITATISKSSVGLSGQTVVATLTNQDGTVNAVTLLDQGDGTYTNSYLIPNIPGYLQISVDADGNDAGTLFTRHTGLQVIIQPEDAEYTGNYTESGNDTNADGLYEMLDFDVEINASKAGDYALSADLYVGNELVAHTGDFFTLANGTQTVTLSFNGTTIRNVGLDGPYTITNVLLIPTDLGLLTASGDDVLSTASYDYIEFGTCYELTLTHSGNGSNPTPAPVNSVGCVAGEYVEGEEIQLSGAIPTSGWAIVDWEGTVNDASIQTSNSVIMLDENHTVQVNYFEDTSTPVVDSIMRIGENPVTSENVRFVVTFSKNVAGVDATDFGITTNGSISSAVISSIEGDSDTYIIQVDIGFGEGTVHLDVIDNDSIMDGAQIPLGGLGIGNGDFDTGENYIVDSPPIITSIIRSDANPTNTSSVDFTVTFSETVTGVDTTDFTITSTAGISGASPLSLTGSGATYTVTVDTGFGNGDIRLDVVADGTIQDTAGNPLDSGFTSGETYTVIKIMIPMGDFDGDGKAEKAIFRPSNSTWYVYGTGSFLYGQAGDIPVPADYNGDGKDDVAVFRPSNSTWYIYGVGSSLYGQAGDIPVPADYNGDGKDDIAIFRPSNSTWYVYGVGSFQYGEEGDIPVVADYNGDGKANIAVFRPTNSTWYVYGVGPFVYGEVGDIPVIADYNGDGKANIAVFRPSNSTWYVYGIGPSVYGAQGDIPVVADYDGDGKADIAVFRTSNSTWYIQGVGSFLYGIDGDIPVSPSIFR